MAETWNDKVAYVSSTVGATVSFEFVGSSVGICHWLTNGKGNAVQPGRVNCWVDDENELDPGSLSENKKITEVDSWTSSLVNSPSFASIAVGLSAGPQ